ALSQPISDTIRPLAALPGQASASIASVVGQLPSIDNPGQPLPNAVQQNLKNALKAGLRDPLAAAQTELQKRLNDLKTSLDDFENRCFADLVAAVNKVRDDLTGATGFVTNELSDSVIQDVVKLNQWEAHLREAILHRVEDGILQLETAAGGAQHL